MAIQIHQLNEIISPAMTDVLAEDTGTDTGKVSVQTLANAMLADYEATFGDGTTDTVINKVDSKVSKAGDTMTGSLTMTGDNTQRMLRINNGVRNMRLTCNADGNVGLYDDTANQTGWILRSSAGGGLLATPAAFSCGNLTVTGSVSATTPPAVQAATGSNKTLTAGSWNDLTSLSLSAGTWVIIAQATTSTTGIGNSITLRLSTSSGNPRQTWDLVSGVYSSGCAADIVTLTATTSVDLTAYSAGTPRISYYAIKAVRII